MNDFDRFLEIELREMLDPVAATQPPRRRGHRRTSRPVLAVLAPIADTPVLFGGAAIEMIPVEPSVAIQIAPGAQL
jgi:hypothetical protein